jgi:hypothetical protein
MHTHAPGQSARSQWSVARDDVQAVEVNVSELHSVAYSVIEHRQLDPKITQAALRGGHQPASFAVAHPASRATMSFI